MSTYVYCFEEVRSFAKPWYFVSQFLRCMVCFFAVTFFIVHDLINHEKQKQKMKTI